MGNIYSNHLHFLSYLLKCPVDKAGNSFSESLNLKLFWGVRPHADPPTLERLRPSNFFPLRTPSKNSRYVPTIYYTNLENLPFKTVSGVDFSSSPLSTWNFYCSDMSNWTSYYFENTCSGKCHNLCASITKFLNANGPDSLSETATVSVKQIL